MTKTEEYSRIVIYKPYTGETKSYYGIIRKETKRYITIEINPERNPDKHHVMAKIHRDLITHIY